MDSATASFIAAKMRLDRAISTVGEQLRQKDKNNEELEGAVRRIVIFVNTVAEALSASEGTPDAQRAADLLWRLGEGLGMANMDAERRLKGWE